MRLLSFRPTFLVSALLSCTPLALALVLLAYRAKLIGQQLPDLYRHDDFNHYYATAFLLKSGSPAYGVPFAETALSAEMVWQPLIPSATNPPSLAFLTYPLAFFPPAAAWAYWSAFLIACSVGCLWLITQRIFPGWPPLVKATCWAMFLGSTAFYSNALLSQVQPLMLLMVIAGWACWREGKLTAAAVVWGASAALKLYTWPLLLLPLVNRRWTPFAAGTATAVVVFLLPGVIFGPQVLIGFMESGVPIIERSARALSQNVSLAHAAAAFMQLFHAGRGSAFEEFAGNYLFPAGFVFLAALLAVREFGEGLKGADMQVVIVGTLAFFCAPVSWESYLLALLLPMSAAWNYSQCSRRSAAAVFLLWLFVFYRPHPARLGAAAAAAAYSQIHYLLMTLGALVAVILAVRAARSSIDQRGAAA